MTTKFYNFGGLSLLSFIISLSFTFQLSNLSLLLKFAGATNTYLPLIWLIPPMTGLFIQPIVGYFSDNTTSAWGRRRPYILFWTLCAALSFLLVPLSSNLLTIIVLTFLADCSLNGSAESLRALTADTFPTETQRTKMFSIIAFFAGVGGFCGALLPKITAALFNVTSSNNLFFPNTLCYAYVIVGFCILLCGCYFLFYKENNFELCQNNKPIFRQCFRNFFNSFKGMTRGFYTILFIHSITWLGLFIFWLYFSVFIEERFYGHSILNDKEKLHQMSLSVSYYFAIYQYVGLLFNLLFSYYAHLVKAELVHSIATLVGGLGIFLLGSSSIYIPILCCMIGVFWGSLIALPYAIVLNYLPKKQVGAYLGIFNISITLPQIMGGLLLPLVYNLLHSAHYILMLSGLIIFISGLLWLRFYYLRALKSDCRVIKST